jgi:RecA/RadA recombinase
VSGFEFRPAVRQNVPLVLGVAGPTGGGKTYSALRLAKGLAGDARFAVIDTENGRALHYADEFAFDHGSLEAPFTPERYAQAIKAADEAGYPVIVVDSASPRGSSRSARIRSSCRSCSRSAPT